ncbi:MAG: DUF2490 domain-containing protein [Bacteroidetes bacterium]|nr:DUF2490 domain-containing protein [Bacteroidota bacterium]MDA1345497.1 DUF2490 domain-containing protein [Bacteroidota bacterium]
MNKNFSKHTTLPFLFLIFFGLNAWGQDFVTSNAWNAVFTTKSLTASTSIQLELHNRTQQFYAAQDQYLIRPNIGYRLNKNLQLRLGVTHIKNAPATLENNIWEQLFFRYPKKWGAYGGWIRIEHRNIQKNNQTLTNHRLRYRMFLQKPLSAPDAQLPVSLFVMGEFFWKLQKGILASDQLWKFVGFNVNLNPKMLLRTGYQMNSIYQTAFTKRVKNIWNTILFINI